MTRPKTLKGFKSRAKKIKKESGCSHAAALEQMAQATGFKNYREAHRHYITAEIAEDVDRWRTINTAAPVGVRMRVAHEMDPSSFKDGGFCPAFGEFDGTDWHCNVGFVCHDGMLRFDPTHWMPVAEGGAA